MTNAPEMTADAVPITAIVQKRDGHQERQQASVSNIFGYHGKEPSGRPRASVSRAANRNGECPPSYSDVGEKSLSGQRRLRSPRSGECEISCTTRRDADGRPLEAD
jgi:hypothetical protein